MKINPLFSAASLAAAMALAGASSANADVVVGKVVAITKSAKSSVIEIAPSTTKDSPSSHRYSVSTAFLDVVELLSEAIPTNATVTISTAKSCATSGLLRDCGSIVSVESVRNL